jgi:FixJ family two-component response regulator
MRVRDVDSMTVGCLVLDYRMPEINGFVVVDILAEPTMAPVR